MRRLCSLLLWTALLPRGSARADVPVSVTRLLDTHRFETLADPNISDIPLSTQQVRASAEAAWHAYQREQSASPGLAETDRLWEVRKNGKTMRYFLSTLGEKGPHGYPLYIALHGGGTAPPYVNETQWEHMKSYYKHSIQNGIYVAPRAISDTWDMHFQPDSYELYKQLIAQMILLHEVDPDRVYLLGFSAGGDGVYQIAPRISDRLAAANMSAGHPNGVSPINLLHVPFLLQVGEHDRAYDRNRVTAEYDIKLTSLRETAPEGYRHQTFMHAGKGHNFYDNDAHQTPQATIADPQAWLHGGERALISRNTNAVIWLDQFSRNPLPTSLVWDLTTVAPSTCAQAPTQHHWLDIGQHTATSLGTGLVRRHP